MEQEQKRQYAVALNDRFGKFVGFVFEESIQDAKFVRKSRSILGGVPFGSIIATGYSNTYP